MTSVLVCHVSINIETVTWPRDDTSEGLLHNAVPLGITTLVTLSLVPATISTLLAVHQSSKESETSCDSSVCPVFQFI